MNRATHDLQQDDVTTAVVVKRVIPRVTVRPELQQVVVTESRRGGWIFFWLVLLGGLWAAFATARYVNPALLLAPVVWAAMATFLVPAAIVGAIIVFPHVRLIISQPDCFCEVQKRWLFVTWSSKLFHLDDYHLTMGRRTMPAKGGGEEASLVRVVAWLITPWWLFPLAFVKRKKREMGLLVGPTRPTVSVVHPSLGDVHHLITLQDATVAHEIVEAARDILPRNVQRGTLE